MFLIELSDTAKKHLKKIPKKEQGRIIQEITNLGFNPFPIGYKKLKGSTNYRIRIGIYRVVYYVFKEKVIVLVLDINHRKDIYKTT